VPHPGKELTDMTIDERREALTAHLEILSGMHEDLEKKHVSFTAK
jgi:hypothetical protein